MNIEGFFLCDAATDQCGKLNILGAFDTISVKTLSEHSSFSIAARIRDGVAGAHSIKTQITGKNNKIVHPKLEGSITFKSAAASNVILNIARMKFEQYGRYKVDLIMDGKIEASLPLIVREIKV